MIEKLRERFMVEFVLGKDASRQPRLNFKSYSLLFLIGSDTFFLREVAKNLGDSSIVFAFEITGQHG